jgi:hypothetical protein
MLHKDYDRKVSFTTIKILALRQDEVIGGKLSVLKQHLI